MTRNFYAIDYAFVSRRQQISAFASKAARDTFVADGNRRFAKTAREATTLCRRAFECTAQEAARRGFICRTDLLILENVSEKTDRTVRNGGPWRTTIKYREPNAASKMGRRIQYVTCYGRTKKDSIASANIQIQLRVEDAKDAETIDATRMTSLS